ncbi:unnamed protein product, partial [marine sediment metagenome]
LRKTQASRPDWKGYDPYIDEYVGIDIRIEEQEAVRDMIEDALKLMAAEQDRRRGLNQTIRML